MKQDLLEAEIRLLLLKYGSDAVHKALARVQGVSVEELRASITRLEGKRPRGHNRRISTALEVVNDLRIESSEKAALLKLLALRFDNRTFLGELRDVRALLNRFHLDLHSIRSRQDSARRLFGHLASLSVSELKRVEEEYPTGRGSAFSELAGEIIGARGKGFSPSD